MGTIFCDGVIKNKVNRTTESQLFNSSYNYKWLLYPILGGKPVRYVQIDPSTNNGDMADRANHYVVYEGVIKSVSDTLVSLKVS